MLPRVPFYKMRTIIMKMMMIFSVTPAGNYFRFDQETDPTDYNKHESWQKHL